MTVTSCNPDGCNPYATSVPAGTVTISGLIAVATPGLSVYATAPVATTSGSMMALSSSTASNGFLAPMVTTTVANYGSQLVLSFSFLISSLWLCL